MPAISEIMEFERDHTSEISNFKKVHLVREGSFIRAYEFSAWLLINALSPDYENVQKMKVTHKKLKDGSDFLFVGFPQSSMDKYIPREAQTEVVDDTHFIVFLEEETALQFPSAEEVTKTFEEWKNSFPISENKPKKDKQENEGNSSLKDTSLVLSAVIQEIQTYKVMNHNPFEWGQFLTDIQQKLSLIV